MTTTLTYGLQGAWYAGIKEMGFTPDEMTEEEVNAMWSFINTQKSFIGDLLRYITSHDKSSGTPFSVIRSRIDAWIQRWKDAYNRAALLVKGDPKLKWVFGKTEKHCVDCLKYAGKVKRQSYWLKIGAQPQSSALACGGWRCDCSLVPTTEKLSRGRIYPPVGQKGK